MSWMRAAASASDSAYLVAACSAKEISAAEAACDAAAACEVCPSLAVAPSAFAAAAVSPSSYAVALGTLVESTTTTSRDVS